MNSFSWRLFNRRAVYFFAAAVLLLAIVPALVSAAQVTERSIALSSSSVKAPNVAYTVKFQSASTAAGAVVIDFCKNSPVIGETCAEPTGFDAHTATTGSGFTIGTLATPANNKVLVTGTVAASTAITIELAGITNPDDAGPLYARILTYTDSSAAEGYTSAAPGTHIDEGGVAMSITPTIGVSAAVLETMTFCVAKNPITANCANANTGDPENAPIVKLGTDVNGVAVLDSNAVYTGTINTQISTNASNGAVVSLKSSAASCGGLINSSKPGDCYILPALRADITKGEAKFGVKLGANDIDATNGTIQAVPSSGYNASTFALNYAALNASGVTSTYGDPILDTDSKPANNKNMALTFGASVSNNTPAGSYSADLSMIATGKF